MSAKEKRLLQPVPRQAILSESVQGAARLLKLLASEQRLRLLCRLLEGEASVSELTEYSGMAQATTSQHLAKMRAEGLVETRREAQSIFYRLEDRAARQVLDTLCDVYSEDGSSAKPKVVRRSPRGASRER